MKKYLSIERNFRGFTYTREFDKKKGFWKAMQYQIDNENNEVEWAKCVDSETGETVATYSRGQIVPEIPGFEGTREALNNL